MCVRVCAFIGELVSTCTYVNPQQKNFFDYIYKLDTLYKLVLRIAIYTLVHMCTHYIHRYTHVLYK